MINKTKRLLLSILSISALSVSFTTLSMEKKEKEQEKEKENEITKITSLNNKEPKIYVDLAQEKQHCNLVDHSINALLKNGIGKSDLEKLPEDLKAKMAEKILTSRVVYVGNKPQVKDNNKKSLDELKIPRLDWLEYFRSGYVDGKPCDWLISDKRANFDGCDCTKPIWSPNGTTAAFIFKPEVINGGLLLVDNNSKKKSRRLGKDPNSGSVADIAWSPDGKFIVTKTLHQGSIVLWECKTREKILTITDQKIGWPRWLSGELIITDHYGHKIVWNIFIGKKVLEYNVHEAPCSIKGTPDGKLVIAAFTDKIVVYNSSTGNSIYTIPCRGPILVHPIKHHINLPFKCLSPDGNLMIAWIDEGKRTLGVFRVETGEKVCMLDLTNNDLCRGFWSPSGEYMVSASNAGAHVWNIKTGKIMYTIPVEIITSRWSPDGKYIATLSRDRRAEVWNALTGEKISTCDIDKDHYLKKHLKWSRDGRFIISILGRFKLSYTTAALWNAMTGNIIHNLPHCPADTHFRPQLSPDCSKLISGYGHGCRAIPVIYNLDYNSLACDHDKLAHKNDVKNKEHELKLASALSIACQYYAKVVGVSEHQLKKNLLLLDNIFQSVIERQECPICLEEQTDLQPEEWGLTPCCHQFICRNDLENLKARGEKCPLCRGNLGN